MKSPSEDKRPFCVVPVRAVASKKLLESDRQVLMALGYYANRAGVCWPSVRSLCDVAGVENQTVQNAIKRLIKAKMIRQLNPNDYDQKAGIWGMSNRYQVLWNEDDPVPTWEQVRDANLLQPMEDRDPVSTEGSGVRGTDADLGQQKRMIAAYEQAIEAICGVKPPAQPGREEIAARLAADGVEPIAIQQETRRLQLAAVADRRGIVPFSAIAEACTNDKRSDEVCTTGEKGSETASTSGKDH